MSFSQGVSGLNSAAATLDVIGNNIANAGTVGYKSGSVQFANVYAGSQAGLGTKVTGVFQDFTAGAVQTSTRPLDIAIVDGKGFFRMANAGGEISYSRNGQFNVDKSGFMTNASGLRLTGYTIDAGGALTAASPTALTVPTTSMEPAATTTISAQFNIDGRSLIPAKSPFDATDSTSYNYSNSTTIFDSLGNPHELSEFFVKTGTNKWDVYATSDGRPLATGGAFAPAPTFPPHAPVAGSGGTPVGSVGFDSAGKIIVQVPTAAALTAAATDAGLVVSTLATLNATAAHTTVTNAKTTLDATPEGAAALTAATLAETAAAAATAAPTNATLASAAAKAAADSATATAVASATAAGIAYAAALVAQAATPQGIAYAQALVNAAATAAAARPSVDTLNFSGLTFPNGSTAMIFNMGVAGTTQFSADNEVREMIPDGYASGSLSTLSVGEDGILIGKYSNQQSKVLGQIVLSSFANTSGLQDKGNNVWIETAASGAPLTGTPGSGKTMGRLLGGATEASNVDLTAELINLIIAQRTYQANTQTVKTQDQVVQALINMR